MNKIINKFITVDELLNLVYSFLSVFVYQLMVCYFAKHNGITYEEQVDLFNTQFHMFLVRFIVYAYFIKLIAELLIRIEDNWKQG